MCYNKGVKKREGAPKMTRYNVIFNFCNGTRVSVFVRTNNEEAAISLASKKLVPMNTDLESIKVVYPKRIRTYRDYLRLKEAFI